MFNKLLGSTQQQALKRLGLLTATTCVASSYASMMLFKQGQFIFSNTASGLAIATGASASSCLVNYFRYRKTNQFRSKEL